MGLWEKLFYLVGEVSASDLEKYFTAIGLIR